MSPRELTSASFCSDMLGGGYTPTLVAATPLQRLISAVSGPSELAKVVEARYARRFHPQVAGRVFDRRSPAVTGLTTRSAEGRLVLRPMCSKQHSVSRSKRVF
jgi:hypothetical protein